MNGNPGLTTPFTVTTILPVVAPNGTSAVIDVALHCVGAALVPLNVTALVPPCVVEPKLPPVMVTEVPTVAGAGDTFVMNGPLVIAYVPDVVGLAEYPDAG